MTLIRDLIRLPEQVHRGDFVLRLSEGIERSDETLRDYVVTPQLAAAFDDALGFIKGALEARSSKASYLHGSFGSGKSHFMAVLNLLLRHEPSARAIPELGPAVARHDAWLAGKRFLLVPYHMIDARSMEAAILGHYADHVRKLHPEAPLPGVYQAEGLFRDAARLRETLGDEDFFALLNEGSATGSSGWGNLAASWTASSYDAAVAAAPQSEPRARLVGALVARFFSAYQGMAGGHEEAFVSLDQGLSILSRHAKGLGYDGVVLFLDELVLWLASRAADRAFISREGQKVAKLVESETADRPVPIISFVARQRDLRELVGEHVTGAEQLGFADVLKYWEARFHTITLEDRNLPAIAEKRVLSPRSESARQQLDQAFRDTARVRDEVMNVLLTSTGDREMFRRVYPFSPALIQVLVAVSSALQRERTALKVMLQLLVSQRERLKLGDVVPVGDLFDAIAEGDEAFTDVMRRHFDNAKRLYHHKLLPMLEQQHGVKAEEARVGAEGDTRAVAFRADDRLLKTLLLAALVPEVEALRGMTAARLAALNHGTILSPIPGREAQIVLSKSRQWASQVGEIRVGGEANPTIHIQLTGVDTESILDKARVNDNFANRLRRVREILFSELGLENTDDLFVFHEHVWRGTRRRCEVVFANVRELPDESLRSENDWKLVIDFPFDDAGHTPAEDRARLARFEQTGRSSRTLVWMPSFLTPSSLKDLATYAVLDHVLTGDRFGDYASHLSAVDRAAAKGLLENQKSQLRQRLITVLEGAYAVAPPAPGSVDSSHHAGLSDQFVSLDPTFQAAPPVGANLQQALASLLDQGLKHQFPAHPSFDVEVKGALLRRVHDEVQRATQTVDGRIPVDKSLRPSLRQVANPLELGTMHETHFLLGQRWKDHFLRKMAEETVSQPTVGHLRRFMDQPQPMGLPKEVQNLVILTFAAQTSRSFFRHGGLVEPALDGLQDEMELREEVLPPQEQWEKAVERAAAIFGVVRAPLRTAANVAQLEADVLRLAQELREPVRRVGGLLADRAKAFGLSSESDRLRTAAAGLRLVEALVSPQSAGAVAELVRAEAPGSDQALGRGLKSAAEVVGVLESTGWEVFEAAGRLTDERKAAAAFIQKQVAEALAGDELAVALGPALRSAHSDALRLLVKELPPAPPPPPPVDPPHVAPPQRPLGEVVVDEAAEAVLESSEAQPVLQRLQKRLQQDPTLRLRVAWKLVRKQ